jgi:hypothetical protein
MSDQTNLIPKRLETSCWLAVAVGVALCAGLGWTQPEILWQAYLFAFVCCWLVTMGGVGLLALGNLTGGQWAVAARPSYLAALRTLPSMVLLFVPIGLGLAHIYPWAINESPVRTGLPPGKAEYLSPTFFLYRSAAYFAIWLFAAAWLSRVSSPNLPPASTPAMRRAGAVSLVLLVPTTTFAAIDWAMSLEPHWYSSIYGAILTASGVVAAQCLAIIGLSATSAEDRKYVALPTADDEITGVPLADVCSDLGNLLLAFVMIWAYLAFSQFLIIWSGNLPEEISWYLIRFANGWQFAALAVVASFFIAPFLLLLSHDRKRNTRGLAKVAFLALAGHLINMYWTVVPSFPPPTLASHILNVAALVAVGSLWLAQFIRQLNLLAERSTKTKG